MRWLTYSLLIFACCITIGLGMVLDTVYQYVGEKEQDEDHVQLVESFAQGLMPILQAQSDPHSFIENWPSGHTLQLSLINIKDMQLPAALLFKLKQKQPLTLATKDSLSSYLHIEGPNVLKIERPIVDVEPKNQILRFALTGGFYIGLAALLVLWLYPLIKQLLKLRDSARKFGQGYLQERITPSRIPYIRDIESEFNAMANRIENLIYDMKLLSSAISHDLRTPLAKIRFGLDTLVEADDPALRQRFQTKVSRHVDEMTALVEATLEFAKLEQGADKLSLQMVDVNALLKECLHNIDTGVCQILFQSAQHAKCYGDPKYLKMAFNNLLQNAQRYCDKQIQINIQASSCETTVSIFDDGCGLGDKLVADVLKPFVKDKAGNHSGYGLGLAIVSRVVEWHRGSIHVEKQSHLGGAGFIIYLPATPTR